MLARERMLRHGPTAVLVLACAAAAVLASAVAAGRGAPLTTDVAVRDLLGPAGDGLAAGLATALTQLGAGPVLYPALAILCLWGWWRHRSVRDLVPLAALAAGQMLELVVFVTLRRPGPFSGLLSTTFSSGHSAAAVLGWGLIGWQAGRLWGRAVPARWLWTGALSVGALVGVTRVYLGLHWVSDAVAGVAVGAALLALALLVVNRVDRADRADNVDHVVTVPAPAATRLPAWLVTSRRAWLIPAAAALVPVGSLVLGPSDERLKDLLVYHGAAGVAGAGENLYAFRTAFSMPFTYPPFAALVVEPISRMPLGLAQVLWTAATLAALVGIAATTLRPVADRIGVPLTVTALLVSSPVRSHLRFGQVGVFLVLLVTLDLLRGREGRLVGWGLGLATAIKLTPAVFLPWLLVTQQWRRFAGTLVWVAGATIAGLVLLWPSTGDYLFRASRDTSRFGSNDWPGNQSVRGMLLRADWLSDATAERVWLVTALVLVAIGTWQAWRCERAGNRLAAVGVLAALSVAASPISWVHHLIWLTLPIAALAAAGRFRLVAAWFLVLVVSLPAVGHSLGWPPVTDGQGLTAVAAVFLLPYLTLHRDASAGDLHSRDAGDVE